MRYFLDFDRTIFDTPSFKKESWAHPSFFGLMRALGKAVGELVGPYEAHNRRRRFFEMLGTFVSHGRFAFTPNELAHFLYPDVRAFLAENDCTIVTYGVSAFIRAKVTSALTDMPNVEVVYTHRRKGPVIRRLIEGEEGPFVFVDDARFQLASVSRACPEVSVIEMRRDGRPGDGRWPVVRSLTELEPLPIS